MNIESIIKPETVEEFWSKVNKLLYLKYPTFIADVLSKNDKTNTYFVKDNELVIYYYDYEIDPLPNEELSLHINYNEIKDCMDITIKLDNYRKYFNSNNEFTFCLAYIHLMKRDENSKDDCLLRLFKENNLLGKSIQINYDLDKVLIELPLYYVCQYDIIKQAIINCLRKQEIKDKPKLLEL